IVWRWKPIAAYLTARRNCDSPLTLAAKAEAAFWTFAMNIFNDFEARFLKAADALKAAGVLPVDADAGRITVEPPREAAHGDVASNAAMILAKPARMAPRELAEHFVKQLEGDPDIAKVEIAGPGFINVTLVDGFWPDYL